MLAGVALALALGGGAATTQPSATASRSLSVVPAGVVRTGPLVALAADSGAIVPFPRVAGSSSEVSAIVADGRGGWFVGGSFAAVGGFNCRGIVHIRATRKVDRTWCPKLTWPGGYTEVSVTAVTQRGNGLFVGGNFSRVGGAERAGLAAIDARSAKLLGWTPPRLCHYGSADNGLCTVGDTWDAPAALVTHRGALYVYGAFSEVSHQPRSLCAAIDLASGKLLPWNPKSDVPDRIGLHTLVTTKDALLAAGAFTRIGGAQRRGFAALDYVSARARPLRVQQTVCAAGHRKVMVVTRGRIFLSVLRFEHGVPNCRLAAYNAASGAAIRWTPALPKANEYWDLPIAALGRTLYVHHRDFDTFRSSLVRVDALTGRAVGWSEPVFNVDEDVAAIAPAGRAVIIGGDFGTIG